MRAVGYWDFSLLASDLLSQPKISTAINSNDAKLNWQRPKQANFEIGIEQASFKFQNGNGNTVLNWELNTVGLGQWHGDFSLDGESVVGNLNVRQLRLLPLSPVLLTSQPDGQPTQEIMDGIVNATLKVDGNISNPIINGRMSLSQGRAVLGVLPVPIEDIEFINQLKGER